MLANTALQANVAQATRNQLLGQGQGHCCFLDPSLSIPVSVRGV